MEGSCTACNRVIPLGSRVHPLKCWPEPFLAVAMGVKRFEIRKDDRGFAVGDWLVLREWEPAAVYRVAYPGDRGYTGRVERRQVTYLARGWGMPDGLVVMGIGPKDEGGGDDDE